MLYRELPEDELKEHEDKERYRPGGFHPIMPGDRLGHEGRYKVVDKLGWGYGSTVWLCRDSDSHFWRAVKVLQAKDSNEENQELKIFKLLEDIDREELERNHIELPECYFWQDGPNGKHLCFVSKLVAAMDSSPPSGYGLHSPTMLIDLCFQLTSAVKYLHEKGICHGDIRIQNIGLRLDGSVERLSQRELQQQIGLPARSSEVETLSGLPARPHAPNALFQSSSIMHLDSKYRTGKLVLIDFGLSYETANLPPEQMSYRSNAAPELLLKRSPKGPATDLWALACVFVRMRTPYALVSEFDTWVRVLQEMEWRWGPLPQAYKSDVSAKMEAFDEFFVDKEREALWKPGDPLSIPLSFEAYQRAKDGGSNKATSIQYFLNMAEQNFKYQLTEKLIPREFVFYDGTSDGFSSDEDEDDSSAKHKKPKVSTSPLDSVCGKSPKRCGTTGLSEPHGGETVTPSATGTAVNGSCNDKTGKVQSLRADIQRAIDKGRPYKRGEFPDPANPCICDWDDARDGRVIRISESCTAEQHWYGDPNRVVVWQMDKNEQKVFGNLLEGIFKYEPEERLITEQVLNHRWFKQRREALRG
ncbi:kinase-like domain-containing protein [Apiospora marii]|uniref:non-specific serine/threonine protein kinase n=1 Tax=Apiospora marii TaxID=335849 RepID=A0ABR1RZ02_9PEZI